VATAWNVIAIRSKKYLPQQTIKTTTTALKPVPLFAPVPVALFQLFLQHFSNFRRISLTGALINTH